MRLRCPWQSQTDSEDNYLCEKSATGCRSYNKNTNTLVCVALCRVPKDWNFSVLGVFATKDAAGDKEEGRSGAPVPIRRVQGKTKLSAN